MVAARGSSVLYTRICSVFQQTFGIIAFLATLWYVTNHPPLSRDRHLSGNGELSRTGDSGMTSASGLPPRAAAYVTVVCDDSQVLQQSDITSLSTVAVQ